MESNNTNHGDASMCLNCIYCEKPITGVFSYVFGEPMHRECEAEFVDAFYNEHGENPEFVYNEHEPHFADYECSCGV